MANLFTGLGLKKGDRVAVQAEKSAPALAIYAACLRAGLVLLPLNTAYTVNELEYFLGDAEPGLVICDPARAEAVRAVLPEGAALLTLAADGSGSPDRPGRPDCRRSTPPCPAPPMILPQFSTPRAPPAAPRAQCSATAICCPTHRR